MRLDGDQVMIQDVLAANPKRTQFGQLYWEREKVITLERYIIEGCEVRGRQAAIDWVVECGLSPEEAAEYVDVLPRRKVDDRWLSVDDSIFQRWKHPDFW